MSDYSPFYKNQNRDFKGQFQKVGVGLTLNLQMHIVGESTLLLMQTIFSRVLLDYNELSSLLNIVQPLIPKLRCSIDPLCEYDEIFLC